MLSLLKSFEVNILAIESVKSSISVSELYAGGGGGVGISKVLIITPKTAYASLSTNMTDYFGNLHKVLKNRVYLIKKGVF